MIAKRIDRTDKGNLKIYIKNLMEYISKPHNKYLIEKCVLYNNVNFCHDDVKSQIDELHDNVVSTVARYGNNPISHWVISFDKTDNVKKDNVKDIVQIFLQDLGYSEHQYVYGVHADTNNFHIHIATNRVGLETDKLLREGKGWHKKESRKSCCRIEKKYGFLLHDNSKTFAIDDLETFTVKSEYTGEIITRERAIVLNKPKSEITKEILKNGAYWYEMRTGLKSQQRVLQEILSTIYDKISTHNKFGDVYNLLAKKGVTTSVVMHGNRPYLTFSLDGINFEKASNVCANFTAENIAKLTGSTYRKPRASTLKTANRIRKLLLSQTVEDASKGDFSKLNVKYKIKEPVGKEPAGKELSEKEKYIFTHTKEIANMHLMQMEYLRNRHKNKNKINNIIQQEPKVNPYVSTFKI